MCVFTKITDTHAKKRKRNNNKLVTQTTHTFIHHPLPPLHTLVVKQPKCRLISEAAPLISTSSFCSGPGITPSNLVVSYLLETNQPDQMNDPLCTCLDAQRTLVTHKHTHTHAHIHKNANPPIIFSVYYIICRHMLKGVVFSLH